MKGQSSSLSRDFFIFAVIIAFAIGFLSLLFTVKISNNLSENILYRLDAQAGRIERTLTEDFQHVAFRMEQINKQIIQNRHDPKYIYNILSTYRSNPEADITISWNTFNWVNEALQLTVNGDKGILENPIDMSMRGYLQKATREPWKLQLGTPVYGVVSNQWIIPAGMGAATSTGQFLGATVFGFDIYSLVGKLERVLNTEGVSFAIVDNNYDVIIESDSFKEIPERAHFLEALKNTEITAEKSGILSRQPILGRGIPYAMYQRIPDYSYILLLAYDQNLARDEILGALIPRIIELFIVGLFLVLLLYLFYRRIVSPIVDLAGVADKISRGEEHVIIPSNGPQEVLELAEQLRNVQRYVEELRLIRTELQRKTRELEEAHISDKD